jgi:hypothetical protein
MYYFFLIFLIITSSFNYINLEDTSLPYKCKNSDINREIEIGDEVTLCIHSIEKNIKIAYKLKVDKYSIITIKNGYDYLTKTQGDDSQTPGTDNSRLRNLIYEPNGEDKKDIIKENSEEFGANGLVNRDEIPILGEGKEKEKENEGEKEKVAKVIAQIGDKMTKYPSVSVIFIIFIYFIFSYIIKKREQKFLLYSVLLLK